MNVRALGMSRPIVVTRNSPLFQYKNKHRNTLSVQTPYSVLKSLFTLIHSTKGNSSRVKFLLHQHSVSIPIVFCPKYTSPKFLPIQVVPVCPVPRDLYLSRNQPLSAVVLELQNIHVYQMPQVFFDSSPPK